MSARQAGGRRLARSSSWRSSRRPWRCWASWRPPAPPRRKGPSRSTSRTGRRCVASTTPHEASRASLPAGRATSRGAIRAPCRTTSSRRPGHGSTTSGRWPASPPTSSSRAENNAKAQAAALMMSAQGDLEPQPAPHLEVLDAAGRGRARANLTIGSTGPVGHRPADEGRLSPRSWATAGRSSTPRTSRWDPAASPTTRAATRPRRSTWRTTRPRSTDPHGTGSWPGRRPGSCPIRSVYRGWSFVLRGADFANATVTMTRNGDPVDATVTSRADWAGPGLVWLAGGLTQARRGHVPRTTTRSR